MTKTITRPLILFACALLLTPLVAPDINLFVDSAYARGNGGGGGAGGGGGNGGGNGAGGGKGGGGMGAGLGNGHGGQKGAAGLAGANGKGLANRSDGPGNATSAAATSKETTGLAKAMSVVSTTAASIAAAFSLQSAFDRQTEREADVADGLADATDDQLAQ